MRIKGLVTGFSGFDDRYGKGGYICFVPEEGTTFPGEEGKPKKIERDGITETYYQEDVFAVYPRQLDCFDWMSLIRKTVILDGNYLGFKPHIDYSIICEEPWEKHYIRILTVDKFPELAQ